MSRVSITPIEPIAAAQRTFRTLLTATSRPGTVHTLVMRPGETAEEAIAFALVDHEVAFAVHGERHGAGTVPVARRITLRTGSLEAAIPRAAFIFAYDALGGAEWAQVRRGTLAYPDGGATIVFILPAVGSGPLALTLTGPGIETEQQLALSGLPAVALAARDEACRDYPMGVDCIFVDPSGRLACLPRSSRIVHIAEG